MDKLLPVMRHSTDFSLTNEFSVQLDSEYSIILIILNYDLPCFSHALWSQARLRVCVDGGANRLFDELPKFLAHEEQESVRRRHKPDVIIGDLDSIRPEVRDFYAQTGTIVIDQSLDQDSNDLEKCVSFVLNSSLDPEIVKMKMKLLVVGALGGRFDHVAANINVLYKFSRLRIVLLGDESLLYLLPRGFRHEISVNTGFEGPHCGLIPFGRASESTTTTGLHWNLTKTKMAFGSLISTSNLVEGDFVTVLSDSDLIWTAAIRLGKN